MSRSVGVAIGIYLLINSLFLYKYGSRVTSYAEWACLVYVVVNLALLHYRRHFHLLRARWPALLAMAWIAGFTILVHFAVPLEQLNVDRWSVITSFLDTLFAGEYPYAARSHLGNPPGPMPVYFFLAAPFYALGWLESLSALGYLLAIFWLGRKGSIGILSVLMLAFSPCLYWEVAVRSNIFTFALLVLIALQSFLRRRTLLRAISVGLILATRSVFALAYVVYYAAIFRDSSTDRWRFFRYATLSAGIFFLVFLPFLVIWTEGFLNLNPFIIQGSFLVPPAMVITFFLLAAAVGAWVPRKYAAYASGLLLFGIIGLYSAYHLFMVGWERAYLESTVDISYFLFCIPFLGYFVLHSRWAKAEPILDDPRIMKASGSNSA